MNLSRGDVVLAVHSGDYGKVRPAVVLQADWVSSEVDSVIVTLLTSHPSGADFLRLAVLPTSFNGIRVPSQLMIEKTGMLPRARIKERVGRLDDETMAELSRRFAVVVGLSDA